LLATGSTAPPTKRRFHHDLQTLVTLLHQEHTTTAAPPAAATLPFMGQDRVAMRSARLMLVPCRTLQLLYTADA
jgi:hypothetical protein